MEHPAADVVIYTTPWCPYCILAKRILDKKGVSYQDVDVSGQNEARAWLRDLTGSHTVPQIFIRGKSIGGCDDMRALDSQGKLDSMLAGHSAV